MAERRPGVLLICSTLVILLTLTCQFLAQARAGSLCQPQISPQIENETIRHALPKNTYFSEFIKSGGKGTPFTYREFVTVKNRQEACKKTTFLIVDQLPESVNEGNLTPWLKDQKILSQLLDLRALFPKYQIILAPDSVEFTAAVYPTNDLEQFKQVIPKDSAGLLIITRFISQSAIVHELQHIIDREDSSFGFSEAKIRSLLSSALKDQPNYALYLTLYLTEQKAFSRQLEFIQNNIEEKSDEREWLLLPPLTSPRLENSLPAIEMRRQLSNLQKYQLMNGERLNRILNELRAHPTEYKEVIQVMRHQLSQGTFFSPKSFLPNHF